MLQPAQNNAAHSAYPIIVTVDKAAPEEKLDCSLEAEHWLLCHLGRQSPLGGSIALLSTSLNGIDHLSF